MKKVVLNPADMPLWLQLSKVSKKYMDTLSAKLSHIGIQRHFYLLVAIGEGEGKLNQQDLADILGIDKVTMVGILDYLSEKGFVERKPYPEDGRKHRIVLTAKARAALPEIRRIIAQLNRQALAALPESLADRFPEVLLLIRRELDSLDGTRR